MAKKARNYFQNVSFSYAKGASNFLSVTSGPAKSLFLFSPVLVSLVLPMFLMVLSPSYILKLISVFSNVD